MEDGQHEGREEHGKERGPLAKCEAVLLLDLPPGVLERRHVDRRLVLVVVERLVGVGDPGGEQGVVQAVEEAEAGSVERYLDRHKRYSTYVTL